MEITVSGGSYNQENNIMLLYEAAKIGSLSKLDSLLEKDPLILHRVPLTPFSETPLHVSTLLGHTAFTRRVLSLNAKLLTDLDGQKRSPLHIAAANRDFEAVREMLQHKGGREMCMEYDECGMTPVHSAIVRGADDVVKELVRAKPESIEKGVMDENESVFHLCVKHNQLKVLKVLVDLMNGKEQLLDFKVQGGNNILHLATMLKQPETVKFLLSLPFVRERVDEKNSMKLTALDILSCVPKDLKSLEIQSDLVEAGLKPQPTENNQMYRKSDRKRRLIKRWFVAMFLTDYDEQGKWIEEMRGQLMVVATVISTMAFQAGISPPGGVWQPDIHSSTMDCGPKSLDPQCVSGTAVLATVWDRLYVWFVYCNTTSFLASVTVILLLVSGIPPNHRWFIRLLSLAMCIAVSSLTVSYLLSVYLVLPDEMEDQLGIVFLRCLISWGCLVGLLGFYHLMRFFVWVLGKFSTHLCYTVRIMASQIVAAYFS